MTLFARLAKSVGNARDSILNSFNKPTPLVPQVLIGLGSMLIRPILIATNKKEDPDRRIYAAAKAMATEVIAFPIAMTIGLLAGIAGGKLAKNPINKGGISGAATTAGFALANIIIPSLANTAVHKLPFKDKIQALISKKDKVAKKPNKIDVVSRAPEFNNKIAIVNTQKKPALVENQIAHLKQVRSSQSGALKV